MPSPLDPRRGPVPSTINTPMERTYDLSGLALCEGPIVPRPGACPLVVPPPTGGGTSTPTSTPPYGGVLGPPPYGGG